MRGEADRAGVIGHRVEAERARVRDQRAQNPAAAWQVADLRDRRGVDARVEEALETGALLVDDAERRIAGTGQGGRGLGQLL